MAGLGSDSFKCVVGSSLSEHTEPDSVSLGSWEKGKYWAGNLEEARVNWRDGLRGEGADHRNERSGEDSQEET